MGDPMWIALYDDRLHVQQLELCLSLIVAGFDEHLSDLHHSRDSN
jgi:hypothetical protein